MKHNVSIIISTFAICLLSGNLHVCAIDSNVIGYTGTEIHKGRNEIAVSLGGIGGAPSRVGDIRAGACVGDILTFGDFQAVAEIVDGELHWVSKGRVVDDAVLPEKGTIIVIDRERDETTTILFSGEVDPVDVQEPKSSTPRQAETDKVKKIENPAMYLADYLSYSTIRIENELENGGRSTGTGFFFIFHVKDNPNLTIPAIVSNRHVANRLKTTTLTFTIKEHGRPSGKLVKYHTQYPTWQKWLCHPDSSVDIAILPLMPIVNQIKAEKGLDVFFMPFDTSMIPNDEQFRSLTQLDEVAMIGYPNGLWDEVNNQPIFRKGAVATRPSMNYNGKREFLVDMSVFPGSSGSPILLLSEGTYYDRKRMATAFGHRHMLLGIIHATHVSNVVGDLVMRTADLRPVHQQPNNLGIVIHASRLREMEDAINQMFNR